MTENQAPTLGATALSELPRRKRVSIARVISGGVVLAVLGFFCYSVASANFNWSAVGHYFGQHEITTGVERTVLLTVLAMALGLLLGTLGGVCRLSTNRVLSGTAWLYVWFFRGTPVLVQLLLWFNLALIFPSISIPGVFHEQTINIISPLMAALLGLGVNEGAYLSEIIRGGILAVDPGQREAAMALGAAPTHMYRRIILPQALRIILPTLGNETIGMLKFTSLASIVSYSELLESSEQIYQVTTQVMELLIVASAWYLIMTSILTIGQYYLERYYGRSSQGGRPRALVEQWILRAVTHTMNSRKERSVRV
ncbi:MAG TPA: amino acid ABC transporter permease [Mycobacteriales bacterium]|nr:amino acid ABC transporter permease [Mycobacteriales bacterium]